MIHSPLTARRGLTLERLLWASLLVAALLPRLIDLGRWPLALGEAEQAVAAWDHGYDPAIAPSPLAATAQTLLFNLLGPSDATARLAQAISGALLVLSPWLLRSLIGRGAALGSSLLLLLSPSLLFFSRHASGEIMGALCAVVLLAGLLRWERWGATRDALLAAVALGLGLASGGGFWSVIVALLLAPLLRRGVPAFAGGGLLPLLRQQGWLVLGTFLAAATTFSTHPEGIGWALAQPLAWLRAMVASPALALPFFFTLLLYEFLALTAAVVGTSLLSERAPRLAALALLWAALTLVPATLLNSGWAAGLLWLALPLALLGGAALAHLGERLHDLGEWRYEGAMALGALVLLVFYRIVLQMMVATSGAESVRIGLMLLLATVLFVGTSALGLLAMAGRPDALKRGLALAGLMILALASLSTAWGASLTRGGDPREPLVVAPLSRDLRTTAEALRLTSAQRYRDPQALPIGIQRTLGAAPLWYFRDFRTVSEVNAASGDLPEAALLPSGALPADRVGETIWLDSSWSTAALGQSAQSSPWLRWLLTRQAPGVQKQSATLFMKLQTPTGTP